MRRSAFQNRLRQLKDKMTEMPVDTLWICQPENRRYLSGFKAIDTQLNESSGSLLINIKENLLITDSRYTTEASKEAVDFEVYITKNGLVEDLPRLLKRLGSKVLGFEGGHVTWDLHRRVLKVLKKDTPKVRLKFLNGLIERMREKKDPSEIRALARASKMMSDILGEIIPSLEPGQREADIAWNIENLARESGADGLAFPSIVASGPNGALPHAVPGARKIHPREPITLDVGVKIDGYCCDMTRTIFLGEPRPLFRKIYATVREAQLKALETISPGIQSTYPDDVARSIIRDAGFGEFFGHALGHGVGLAAHETPRLSPRLPRTFEENMVVTVEPGIYIPNKGGVRLEEMVVIGKKGARILTTDTHFYDF